MTVFLKKIVGWTFIFFALTFQSSCIDERTQKNEGSSHLKIVNGEYPNLEDPSSYATVALLNNKYNQVFCSGTLVSEDIIITAKHCILSDAFKDASVFFGSDHQILAKTQFNSEKDEIFLKSKFTRPIIETVVYKAGPSEYPNYDIAWIRFSNGIPEFPEDSHLPRFRPVKILPNSDLLTTNGEILQAGYGKIHDDFGAVSTDFGQKLSFLTKFKGYFNHDRYAHLFRTATTPGSGGTCHGDSGGPAFVKIDANQNGEEEWYLAGTLHGLDTYLNYGAVNPPSVYDSTPVNRNENGHIEVVNCDHAESLYTFVGDYLPWIEKSTGQKFSASSSQHYSKNKQTILNDFHPENYPGDTKNGYTPIVAHNSFKEFCESKDYLKIYYNTITMLREIAVQHRNQAAYEPYEVYNNCELVEQILQNDLPGKMLVLPIRAAKILKEKNFYDLSPIRYLDKVEHLVLRNMKFYHLDELSYLSNLKKLTIENSEILDQTALNTIGLQTSLEELIIQDSALESLNFIEPLKNLRKLQLKNIATNQLPPLHNHDKLDELNLIGNNYQSLNLPAWELRLSKLNLSKNNLAKIPEIDSSNQINEVSLRDNQIKNLDGLNDISGISKVDLTGNCLANYDSSIFQVATIQIIAFKQCQAN